MNKDKKFPQKREFVFPVSSTITNFNVQKNFSNDSPKEVCDFVELASTPVETSSLGVKKISEQVLCSNDGQANISKPSIKSGKTLKKIKNCGKENGNNSLKHVRSNCFTNNKYDLQKSPNFVELSEMKCISYENSIFDKVTNTKIGSVEIYQENRRSQSYLTKNTPPTTPSDRIHSDDWSTFDPCKVRTMSETKVNNILTESLLQSSPEKTKYDIEYLPTVEEKEVISNSPESSQVTESEKTCDKCIPPTNKKTTVIRKFFSRFEVKYDKKKKVNKEKNVNVVVSKGTKNCEDTTLVNNNLLCGPSKVLVPSNEVNDGNVICENSRPLQQILDIERANYLYKVSNKRCPDANGSTCKTSSLISSNKFRTPGLTSYQKRVVDEICTPKFSPALRYMPDVPYGKVLAVYKGETLSTVSATGTIALYSNSRQIPDFKPIAHSTPFQTPRHSLGKNKSGNKNRATILPFDERGNIFENGNFSKEKISLNSNTSPVPSLTAPSYLTHIPEEMYVKKLMAIKQSIRKTKLIVLESEKIIHDCSKRSNFNGTEAELSSNRIKLIGMNKISSLKDEYERTKTLMNIASIIPRINSKFLSTYAINDIKLELNRLFCFKKTQENMSYAFFLLFKSANNVLATQIRTVEDLGSVRLRQIKFPDIVKFSKLPINFIVFLEIYAIKIGELDRTKLSRFKRSLKDFAASIFKTSSKKSSLMSINENVTVNPNDSLHPKNQICFENFTQCGILRLNRDTLGNQKFYLEEAKFPLEGTICINTECSTLPQPVDLAYSGFLSIYNGDDVKGFSIKMWTIVKRSIMKFWKSCEDEYEGQLPVSIIDMSKITSLQLEKIKSTEAGYREDSFYIDIICEPSDFNCIYQQKRIFLTSECSRECENWLQYLNGVLKLIRHEPDSTS